MHALKEFQAITLACRRPAALTSGKVIMDGMAVARNLALYQYVILEPGFSRPVICMEPDVFFPDVAFQ
jgi:hypothetical protein